jgi:hypothetical protein
MNNHSFSIKNLAIIYFVTSMRWTGWLTGQAASKMYMRYSEISCNILPTVHIRTVGQVFHSTESSADEVSAWWKICLLLQAYNNIITYRLRQEHESDDNKLMKTIDTLPFSLELCGAINACAYVCVMLRSRGNWIVRNQKTNTPNLSYPFNLPWHVGGADDWSMGGAIVFQESDYLLRIVCLATHW